MNKEFFEKGLSKAHKGEFSLDEFDLFVDLLLGDNPSSIVFVNKNEIFWVNHFFSKNNKKMQVVVVNCIKNEEKSSTLAIIQQQSNIIIITKYSSDKNKVSTQVFESDINLWDTPQRTAVLLAYQ